MTAPPARVVCLVSALALAGCRGPELTPTPLLDVPQGEKWVLPGMGTRAYVIRTEADVPHIYATSREDLARVAGFVQARDRFFMMDLMRRLALGELSPLLGDAALETDMESRGSGMTWIADHMAADAPEETIRLMAAFAEGVNAYIAAVKAGELPPPSELELAAGLLGAEDPTDLMAPFDVRSMAGIGATFVYELGYETGDVGRARNLARLDGLFDGQPFAEERNAGVWDDIWVRIAPVQPVASAHGWGLEGGARRDADAPPTARPRPAPTRVPLAVLDRVVARQERIQARFGHDWQHGFGSNAWATTAAVSPDGLAYMAGDGHLPLSVPSLFYQIGMDTEHLGGGDTHQVGLVIPGLPVLAVGTNGRVAWSQTQLMGDITDWYEERLQLDADGAPAATWFDGAWQPLERVDETYVIRDVPLLGSVGRTETWPRYTTFDGRWIADIEGRDADPDEELAAGETLVNLQGDWVVPGDLDGDGVIRAITFDYTGFDSVDLMGAVDGFGHADDVWGFREATRKLVAYSQNMAVADANGSVLYTGYQGVPCRDHLDREASGAWAQGADPSLLLDGTRYGAFAIPLDDRARVDESFADDPHRCVVPLESYPHAIDPGRGYVVTANNDPGDIALDGDLLDEPYYIGGPWDAGWRAASITAGLEADIAGDGVTLASTVALQGDHASPLGNHLVPEVLDALEAARAASEGTPASDAETRMAALWDADPDRLLEVHDRLDAWLAAGAPARSGVETAYATVEPGDEAHAVATTIFNTWLGAYVRLLFDDEGLPGVWHPSGSTGRMRTITTLLEGRGPENPLGLSSWHATYGESVFFDILSTPEHESSHEIAVLAVAEALAFLEGPSTGRGEGGFGTDAMDAWLWGLRHWVHFDSLLADFLGDDPAFSAFVAPFSITPDLLPIVDGVDPNHPLYGFDGYPRHGDNHVIDAANPGYDGITFDYGSGPVFRMVVGLGPDHVEGVNVLPGGQSGLNDSPFFADQAALWLGNETLPLRFTVDEVIEGATHRETFLPDNEPWTP